MKRPWSKTTNDDLALNLEMWMNFDGRLTTDWQMEFFDEVIWRLKTAEYRIDEGI